MPGQLKAEDTIKNWRDQLSELFNRIARIAKDAGWAASNSTKTLKEEPFNFGASIQYEAPVLVLKRQHGDSEQNITFEPRHRFTLGAAGRIDLYSRPMIREAMLLRTPDVTNAEILTAEEAEKRVAEAPWKAYSSDRTPLAADLADNQSLITFLNDLAD